jgi:concanavalin A-like lectin/glucanase superfamily protein
VTVNGAVAATIGSVVDQGVASAAQLGATFDLAPYLKPGRNVIVVRGQNGPPFFAGTEGPNPYALNPAAVVLGGAITYEGGPYSYWRFDEASGATAVDQAGANPGAIGGGAARIPGVAGRALQFDGADDAVSFAETFLFHADADASLLVWVKPADDAHRAILWSRDGNGDPDADRFHLFSGEVGFLSCDGGAGFGFDYREPSSALHRLLCATGFPAGQWHQLAITRAGATYALYVDGELFQEVSDASPALPAFAGGWVLGSRDGFMFQGAVDELALYARALTADEVRLRYRRSFQGQGYEDPAPAPAPATCTRWNLAGDFRTPPGQANPSADACGNAVWSYEYAPTPARDPATYLPLDAFQQSWFEIPGLAGWNVESPCFYGPTPCLPIAAYNGSGGTADLPPWAPFPWDATTMLLHPGPSQPSIAAFRAPLSGRLDVEMARVRHLDFNGGDGVDWTLDLGAERVAAGLSRWPVAERVQTPIDVKAGDVLYLAIGPNGGLVFDSTQVDLALRMRSIEVAIDVRPGVAPPNPINLSAGGNVPVALLGTRAFAAASVDPATLTFGGAPVAVRGSAGRQVPQAALQDVNADGILDLVAQFPVASVKLPLGDGTGTLTGALTDGTAVSGSDVVRILK